MPPTRISNDPKGASAVRLSLVMLFLTASVLCARAVSPANDTLYLSYFVSLCSGDNFQGQPVSGDTVLTGFVPGATGTDTAFTWIVDVVALPDVQLQADSFFCTGDTGMISVIGTYAGYAWSNGATGKSILVDQAGVYSVTVTSSLGCTGVAGSDIRQAEIQLAVQHQHPACAGFSDGSIEIIALGDDSPPPHQFLLNGQPAPGPVFDNLPEGDYKIVVTDAAGCADSLTLILQDPPPFEVDLGPDITLSVGSVQPLMAQASQPIAQYDWGGNVPLDCDSCATPVPQPDRSGIVVLEAYDQTGCMATDTLRIFFNTSIPLYVPNVFSPNGDGNNDFLMLSAGPGILSLETFQIFDRWGGQVYSQDNIPAGPEVAGWDGSYQGDRLSPGVYTWLAQVRLADGSSLVRSGNITLLR